MKRMYGVNTPISCPMTENGKVDYDSLKSLCNFLIEKGVDGLYPNGSTGEMSYLTLEERKRILECVLETNNGRKQVFSMVGAQTTKDTIELARHAEAAGADGIGVVTPSYFKLDEEELLSYYQDISASVSEDFSIYLYGIPQLAVNDITPELAERIAQSCPNVAGIKYSYPRYAPSAAISQCKRRRLFCSCGTDDLFFSLLASGGDGTISGNSNVIPEHFVAIYQAFQAGDYDKARRLQAKTNRLITYISGPNNMSRYKIGLKERGVIKCSAVRKPLRDLTPEEEHNYLEQIKSMDYLDITKF